MTDTGQQPERVEVIQADREAAASFYQAHLARPGEVPVAAAMRMRHIDDSPLIQAFASHRLSAVTDCVTSADREMYIQTYNVQVFDRIRVRAGRDDACAEMQVITRHRLTAITEAGRAWVGDEWQVVPREPTEAMLVAAGCTPTGVTPRGGIDRMRRMVPKWWSAALTAAPTPPLPADHRSARMIENLRRALVWHADPARLATTREAWQRDVDDAVLFVKEHPEDGFASRPSIMEDAPLSADVPAPDVERMREAAMAVVDNAQGSYRSRGKDRYIQDGSGERMMLVPHEDWYNLRAALSQEPRP